MTTIPNRLPLLRRSFFLAGSLSATIWSLLQASPAAAAEMAMTKSDGDTAWILTASALVLFMTLPGLALFYGGLVRARNVLSVLMHCFVICCAVSVLWALCGYSLAFSQGTPWLGGLANVLLRNMAAVRADTTLPESVFALFQMTFAVITPALIIGAFPERVSFGFVTLFSALWLMIVYVPAAHWIWGGGWLAERGTLDFAGGIVVHTTARLSALVTAMMIGKRRGFPNHLVPPHSPGMTMTGAGMLWVGWYGFNGGSALAASAGAGSAILATHLAASMAALVWMTLEWLKAGKPTSIGIVTGAVAGLATITPASGYVGPGGALAIGLCGGFVCFYATLFIKQVAKIDDTLDVFAVHGVGGMLGSLLVAGFALPELGGVGLAQGVDWKHQLATQAIAVGSVALWSVIATIILVKVLGAMLPLRVPGEAEYEGLDLSTHGERAYELT